MRHLLVLACLTASFAVPAHADTFRPEDVPSATALQPADIKPGVVAFSDHNGDRLDADTTLTRFETWSQQRPREQQFLSLYRGAGAVSTDTTGSGTNNNGRKVSRENPYMYVAAARFILNKPASAIDLKRFADLKLLQSLDPSIEQKVIQASDIIKRDANGNAAIQNPERQWCDTGGTLLCVQSHYKLEGQLPMGIALANKLSESKKVADFLEFQSEIRLLPADQLASPDLAALTGLSTPVASAIEQNIFYVNEVIQFGKFLAVLQPHPDDPNKTVATAFVALAIKASVFERKKDYDRLPILRNLVPAQVLLGKSSFNTGSSLSAGLPGYSRNRLAAIATMLSN